MLLKKNFKVVVENATFKSVHNKFKHFFMIINFLPFFHMFLIDVVQNKNPYFNAFVYEKK